MERFRLTTQRVRSLALIWFAIVGVACAEESTPAGTLTEGANASEADLSEGSAGSDVAAVHAYLTRYGYFPNKELAESYPWWRPVVEHGPSDPSVFDEHMSAAIGEFQRRADLPITGRVDAETRAVFRRPRCGVPDGAKDVLGGHAEAGGNSQKFAQHDYKRSKSNLTWFVRNTPTNNSVSRDQVRSVASASFASWASRTSLTFTEVTSWSAADIRIWFTDLGSTVGKAQWPERGGEIELSNQQNWTVANPPGDRMHLETTLVHEIGHSLGLEHSSVGGAVMAPGQFPGQVATTLTLDDIVGISTLYDTWTQLPGAAKDIAVNWWGQAWVLGTDSVGGGFSIHRFNGSGWTPVNGGATAIAVDSSDKPWVVNSGGFIYRATSVSGNTVNWVNVPGCAQDIGVGGDGSVWIVGCNAVAYGNQIYKFNGWGWDPGTIGASRIAVASNGVPYVVTSNSSVLIGQSSAANTSFTPFLGCASDIAVIEPGYPWIMGCEGFAYVFNYQPADDVGEAPYRFGWLRVNGGGGSRIAVGPNAQPWKVNANGAILRTLR